MRVIAGRLRGRKLDAPDWPGLRPTSDRLRETLFNVLGPGIDGARVLDLCAGTGAVGIEALSRGACYVVFVDADVRACRLIARNLASFDIREGYAIVHADAGAALQRRDGVYELVFIDAPYDDPRLDQWIEAASAQVAPGGALVVEHSKRRATPGEAGSLRKRREVRAGDSTLSIYRHPASPGGEGTRPNGINP